MRVMTNQHWPRLHDRLVELTLVATVLLFASGSPASAYDLPDQPAKEALALMLDNQNRCYHLADAYRVQIEKFGGEKFAADKAAGAFTDQEGHRLEQARRALGTIRGLVGSAADGVPEETYDGLQEMFEAQTALFGLVTQFSGWESRADFDDAVKGERADFNVARGRVSDTLHLSTAEHRKISENYNFGSSRSSGRPGTSSSETSTHDPLAREMTDDEYQKKQREYEDWLAEQERIRNERLRRRQERQREILDKEAAPEAGPEPTMKPKAGIELPTPAPPPANAPPSPEMVAAMKAWHPRYNNRIFAFKSALRRYLQVKKLGTPRQLGSACGKMSESLAPLLADQRVMNVPDPDVANALKISMTQFKKGADICRTQPDAEQVRRHFSNGEKALTALGNGLQRYYLPL